MRRGIWERGFVLCSPRRVSPSDAPPQEPLAQSMYDHIPVGVGSQGIVPTNPKILTDVLELGMDWSVREVCPIANVGMTQVVFSILLSAEVHSLAALAVFSLVFPLLALPCLTRAHALRLRRASPLSTTKIRWDQRFSPVPDQAIAEWTKYSGGGAGSEAKKRFCTDNRPQISAPRRMLFFPEEFFSAGGSAGVCQDHG